MFLDPLKHKLFNLVIQPSDYLDKLFRSRLTQSNHIMKVMWKYKEYTNKCEYLWLQWIKERSSPWTWSCHVVVVVSFLLEVAIQCQQAKLYCKNFNSFIVDLLYLEDSQVKSSPGFYQFGFPGLSYRVFFIFPHCLHDII